MKYTNHLPVFSLFNYYSRIYNEKTKVVNLIRKEIKDANTKLISDIINEFVPEEKSTFFQEALLVPIPRSSITKKDWPWPSKEICKALIKKYNSKYLELIKRVKKIRKSSLITDSSERPLVHEHESTLEFDNQIIPEVKRIIIVDDVVTAGRTMFACKKVLAKNIEREIPIEAFSLLRTDSFTEEFDKILDPKNQIIECYQSGKTFRS